MAVRVAIAQIDSVVGDLDGNAARIEAACIRAANAGARVVVTPELSLVGYPPEDLLLRPVLYERCDATLSALAARLARFAGLHVLIGHPSREFPGESLVGGSPVERYNCVSVIADGRIVAVYRKHDLPNYEVFDEVRYFAPSSRTCVFEVDGLRLGIVICEDLWFSYAPDAARKAGADVLLVPNGSPYHIDKQHLRVDIARERVRETGLAVVYANLVGGQDELQFDGSSFVLDSRGELRAQLPHCAEAIECVDLMLQPDRGVAVVGGRVEPTLATEPAVYGALVQGVRDYVGKNGFPGAIIGLSGGVDSALTLAIAVDALGADRVRAVMMPSTYTAEMSWIDARDMAVRLGVRYDEIPIGPVYDAFLRQLAEQFEGLPQDATEENVQARIRGTLLMALSNKTGWIVLTTGNKSELATGYCTLYGDMAGGFAVIKDIFKTLVYRLCRWRNGQGDVIPERVLVRPPSAELRPDQTDQDSLPPYEILDDILRRYMEEDEPVAALLDRGHDPATVERVLRLLRVNEYKRRQAPVGVRVTHRAFGRDWRYPITNRFRETPLPATTSCLGGPP